MRAHGRGGEQEASHGSAPVRIRLSVRASTYHSTHAVMELISRALLAAAREGCEDAIAQDTNGCQDHAWCSDGRQSACVACVACKRVNVRVELIVNVHVRPCNLWHAHARVRPWYGWYQPCDPHPRT